MTKVRPVQQVAGWLCILGAVGVLTFVAYGFAGPPGPVGLNALWSEPWFLITLADLYLGVFLAIGFQTRPGSPNEENGLVRNVHSRWPSRSSNVA